MEGWVDMIAQKPLATCDYGWGRTLKLYEDYLDVDGKLYALHELMQMNALYRRVMNVSSLRLELQFGIQHLVLRGINANETANLVVTHLKRYCPTAIITSSSSIKRRVKLMSNKRAEAESVNSQIVQVRHEDARREPTVTPETPRWLLDLAQDMQRMQTRKERRANSLDGRGEDMEADREQLALHLQADTLPSLTVPIPLRLAPGEQARYSIEATLCAELLSDGNDELPSYTYPAKDQGTLILTNRRLVYMGRRGQRVLGYARILRVSRLRGAIALLTDVADATSFSMHGETSVAYASNRTHREIFQVSRPLECALYLDHLLRQFYVQVATKHLTLAATNGLNEAAKKQAAVQHDESRQWSLSTRATEKVAVTRPQSNGITEGIDAHSIQRSLADIETCPLAAIHPVRVSG